MVKPQTILTIATVVIFGGWLVSAMLATTNQITVYQVPKERVSMPPAEGAQGADQPKPQVPEHWQPKEATGMRQASFTVPGDAGHALDVSVVSLAGAAGGLTANVNRWRSQLDLEPERPDVIESGLQTATLGGREVVWVDLSSDQLLIDGRFKKRILVAVVSHGSHQHFFKMVGPHDLVEHEKLNLKKLVEALRLE